MPSRSAFAITRSLAKAKDRYPWARAWVQVRGGIWCFESVQEARLYQPQTSHELFVGSEPEKPKWPQRRKRRRRGGLDQLIEFIPCDAVHAKRHLALTFRGARFLRSELASTRVGGGRKHASAAATKSAHIFRAPYEAMDS